VSVHSPSQARDGSLGHPTLRRLVTITLVLAAAQAAWGQLVHRAFFAREPVRVHADQDAVPWLVWEKEVYDAAWTHEEDGAGVLWSAELPAEAPLGAWAVCGIAEACVPFQRVADDCALLEVSTVPGARVSVSGHAQTADPHGRVVFTPDPGTHSVAIRLPDQHEPEVREVDLAAGRRQVVEFGALVLSLSSPYALPGSTVTLWAELLLPAARLPYIKLRSPEGWTVEPFPRSEAHRAAWEIRVPEDALGAGVFELQAPAYDLEETATLLVRTWLPPEIVIAHWDVARDALDLSTPGAVTYDRILWAAAWIGRELPYAGRVLARAEVAALARAWAVNEGGSPSP